MFSDPTGSLSRPISRGKLAFWSKGQENFVKALKFSSRLSCKTLPKDANVYLIVELLCSLSLSLEPKQVGDVAESTLTPVSQIEEMGSG